MSLIKFTAIVTVCSVLAALLSIVYQSFLTLKQLQKVSTILTGLLAIEGIARTEKPRVAVGYGSCTDLLISATKFLNFTDAALNIGPDFTVDDITNEEEFIQSFAYYFKSGAAAERFISDEKLFKQLINIATTKHKDEITWALGGNAPVMGIRFFKEGADVLLAARMSEKLRKHLPDGLKLAGDLVKEDDIHFILEYKSSEAWGPYTAPRANRYILHNDQNNPHISSLELFDEALANYNPRLLVVSGLQMMDSYKFAQGVRESRLEKVQKQISSQSESTLLHFEMASYVEIELLRLLSKHVIPYVDSIGMNEQELDNLQQVLNTGKIRFASDSNPRVATALDQMRKLFSLINKNYLINKRLEPKRRMLTRVHVHTLAYQAIMVVKESQWNNTKNAAAKASLTAHRYVCGTENVIPESANLILDDSFSTSGNGKLEDAKVPERIELDPKNPVSCWDESMTITDELIEYEVCLAPVLVCRVAKQTAGAGDNISASGLVMQI